MSQVTIFQSKKSENIYFQERWRFEWEKHENLDNPMMQTFSTDDQSVINEFYNICSWMETMGPSRWCAEVLGRKSHHCRPTESNENFERDIAKDTRK